MVDWLSASNSVQSSATTISGRGPTTNGTQEAKRFQTSTPVLEKNRSTCLIACLGLRFFATASARPIVATPSRAPSSAPNDRAAHRTHALGVEVVIEDRGDKVLHAAGADGLGAHGPAQ